MADLFRFNPDIKEALDEFNGVAAFAPVRRDPDWADVERGFAMLQKGNAEFASGVGVRTDPRDFPDLHEPRRHDVANDHREPPTIAPDSPFAAILCCSDHRASPELIFWQGLGRLFVVREAGNLADDGALASLEYAVALLKVPLIVILGHEGCGAVQTALDVFDNGTSVPGIMLPDLLGRFRSTWESRPRGTTVDEAWLSTRSIEETKVELEKLPLIRDRLGGPTASAPNLEIVTGRYDLQSGLVTWLDTGRLARP